MPQTHMGDGARLYAHAAPRASSPARTFCSGAAFRSAFCVASLSYMFGTADGSGRALTPYSLSPTACLLFHLIFDCRRHARAYAGAGYPVRTQRPYTRYHLSRTLTAVPFGMRSGAPAPATHLRQASRLRAISTPRLPPAYCSASRLLSRWFSRAFAGWADGVLAYDRAGPFFSAPQCEHVLSRLLGKLEHAHARTRAAFTYREQAALTLNYGGHLSPPTSAPLISRISTSLRRSSSALLLSDIALLLDHILVNIQALDRTVTRAGQLAFSAPPPRRHATAPNAWRQHKHRHSAAHCRLLPVPSYALFRAPAYCNGNTSPNTTPARFTHSTPASTPATHARYTALPAPALGAVNLYPATPHRSIHLRATSRDELC